MPLASTPRLCLHRCWLSTRTHMLARRLCHSWIRWATSVRLRCSCQCTARSQLGCCLVNLPIPCSVAHDFAVHAVGSCVSCCSQEHARIDGAFCSGACVSDIMHDFSWFTGTVCSSCGEALEAIEAPSSSFDVVLAEVRCSFWGSWRAASGPSVWRIFSAMIVVWS